MINKSAIKEIFYGERGQYDSVKCSQEYFNLLGKAADADQHFLNLLEKYPNLRDSYKTTSDLFDDMHAQAVFEFYSEGFKLGVLLGMEIANN